jgi:large subunit ribosomal protein L19
MKAAHYTKETILNMGTSERNFPDFKAGDTICVTVKVKEGAKERLQDFQGTVIKIKGSGIGKTFCVRKITDGVSVEKIFPYFSPSISEVTLLKKGVVRRAKLYYLRTKKGKDAEVKIKQ